MGNEGLVVHLEDMLVSLLRNDSSNQVAPLAPRDVRIHGARILRRLIEGVRRRDAVIDLRSREELSPNQLGIREAAIDEIRLAILLVSGHGIRVRHDFEHCLKRVVRRNQLAAELFELSSSLDRDAEQRMAAIQGGISEGGGLGKFVAKRRACVLLNEIISALQRGDRVIDLRLKIRAWGWLPPMDAAAFSVEQSAIAEISDILERLSDCGVNLIHEFARQDVLALAG